MELVKVPYYVGKGRWPSQRRVGGYWECSGEDAVWALAKSWKLDNGYVVEGGRDGEDAHRLIKERELGHELASDEHVHHRDENPLNNQRDNLLVMTRAEHARHNHSWRSRSGLPPGVRSVGRRNEARITRDGKTRSLGYFDTPEEASAAYQKALREESGAG